MPTDIQRIDDDAIIYITIQSPFKPSEEIPTMHKRIDDLARNMGRPIFRIIDLTRSEIDFSALVEALQEDTNNAAGSATDWRFQPLFVGTDNIAKLAADSLQQQQYGGIKTRLFSTREGAIAHAQQELQRIAANRQRN